MSEPITSSGVIATVGNKFFTYFLAPLLASTVVLMMDPPRKRSEWFIALVSTLFCSFTFGTYLIIHIFAVSEIKSELQAIQANGIFFLSGLPGWFLVKAIFQTLERFKQRDILQIMVELRKNDSNNKKDV